jgi:uncharacterized protein YndB with AHSA1/START domain
MPSSIFVALRVAATPERAFDVFTREIGLWWQHNDLFQFTRRGAGTLALEPGEGGRLTETFDDGAVFEIGRVQVWQPPQRLVLTWRQESFAPEQRTEVHVSFEAVGAPPDVETRVTVQHFGWDEIPSGSVAKHGFPSGVFLQRHAEYWQFLLRSLSGTVRATGS